MFYTDGGPLIGNMGASAVPNGASRSKIDDGRPKAVPVPMSSMRVLAPRSARSAAPGLFSAGMRDVVRDRGLRLVETERFFGLEFMAAVDYYKRYADLAESRGGALLSPKYLGCDVKHEWRCALGHEWKATAGNVKGGRWCPTCGWKRSGSKRRGGNLRMGREIAAAAGGKCLETEEGASTTTARWECAKGHTWRATYGNVIHRKTWCPKCSAEENGER